MLLLSSLIIYPCTWHLDIANSGKVHSEYLLHSCCIFFFLCPVRS